MRKLLLMAAVLAAVGCDVPPQGLAQAELYLRVEVEQRGLRVAAPQVLGFEGRHITVEKRQPGGAQLDYRLDLVPRVVGATYAVRLDLELPNGHRGCQLALLHGEERRVALDQDTELKVMLMRVDSPEFRALVMRAPVRPAAI